MSLASILRQIREQRHFDLDTVATATQISPARLAGFEAGDRDPSIIQLEKLADTYGVPSYFFAHEMLPNLPEAPLDFRRQNPRPAQLSPAGMKRIWAAEKIARFTAQLIDAIRPNLPFSDAVAEVDALTERNARRLRKTFDRWLAPRVDRLAFIGSEEQVFLGALRLFFEVHGLIININDAPADDYSGFFVSDEALPLAFVNRSIFSKKAQLFTLVHEFGHYVLNQQGVSETFAASNNVERQCNQFAAEFLAPADYFESLVNSINATGSALIRRTSRRSLLSNHAAAIRLCETGHLSRAELRDWEKVTAANRRAEKDEETEAETYGQPHAKRVSELGYLPTFAAQSAVHRGLIDRLEVEDGLSLSSSLQGKAFALAERRFRIAQFE